MTWGKMGKMGNMRGKKGGEEGRTRKSGGKKREKDAMMDQSSWCTDTE